MSRNKFMLIKRGVTLIELVIAVALLGVILLTATAVDISVRRFFNVSDRSAALQNEVNPVLLRMKRDVNRAVGVVTNPGIVVEAGNERMRIRIDDFGTDAVRFNGNEDWIAYDRVGNQVFFFGPYIPAGAGWPAAAGEVVADRVTALTLTPITSVFPPNAVMGVDISLAARNNPGAGVSPANPQLEARTVAHALSQPAR